MREYELTYLVSDEVLEKDLDKVTEKVTGIIENEGGKAKKEEAWGRRKLTYPIKKQNFATYVTVWFELPKEKIADIEHELRVHPQIIRHLITLKVEKGKELVVSKEDIVDTGDVKAILGKKSFEMVEGKTEESRDLMAKREKEGEEKPEEIKEKKKVEEKVGKKEKPVIEEKEKKIEEIIEEKPKKVRKVKKAEKEVKVEESIVEEKVKEIKEEPIKEKIAEEKPGEDEADPSRQGEDEADRRKKLDEKLDELLKDDL
ncbi:30S ribosomal protein S6 [Candidatus Berkelbacteria bacterium CG_4_9_14_0_2_um_filter_42_30]|uniref:Small ribosomal subunit protein bS6 n=5 Tax=Candidatus Berkelbacteria TaxID=1618330 RepID=A0A2M7K0V8_9BACT|nr:MAG: 30S ribosomal protein S6 [Candidatus Berkelbacteria bacterium CG1_02_42_45]PIR27016.1 MAG: 30S ribosomal protein S6 [Candidatus Berkelbacteria bacterium CG11_big_fil_rev_8_21_14_0_20_42_15]PIX29890.1 MAG: 30S ribosomal protein S6 [Candidatus Berkelbacteria bacterium CG_4_8_14_3_um_filter_42_13]PIZ27457.1 MAG: 30S ribosomal protein S6 [Candidatus Berkelbacteria bacterium CG_4_10_14_0_8_um_filter_42_34]PJC65675.1 MAG: 30S ribosomal protein S6 [Candidatus Berkelbacteria bacterium CG_4_9_14